MVFGIFKKIFPSDKARILRRIVRGVDMSKVALLRGSEPREILQTAIDKQVPAIMSFLSRRRWHVNKVVFVGLEGNKLSARLQVRRKPHPPVNIRLNQPVGISLKYEYGKYIFETKVISLETASSDEDGGTIVLELPGRIEIIQRRSYFRVNVPKSLRVNALLWCCSQQQDCISQIPPEKYWQGKLVDVSAGGAAVAVESAQLPQLRRGQVVGVRFTPIPYETPLVLNAQIRNVLPTADGKSACVGLQIIGLEASLEGRQVIQQLCRVVEIYYQINQATAPQQAGTGRTAQDSIAKSN